MMAWRTMCLVSGIAALVMGSAAPSASAQDVPAPSLSLELNGVEPSDKGCRLTFVVANDLGADLTRAAFEIALFNDKGVVDRLTVLDFRDLPEGKTKVSRFDLAGTDCAKMGRILVNSVTDCSGKGVQADTCMKGLKTSSKAGITFGL